MRVVFMGTPDFAVPTLEAVASRHALAAVVTRPDRGRGRGRRTGMSAVKERAIAAEIPVEQPPTLRTPEAQSMIAGYAPDVIVVVAYGLILPREVLELPPHGCINVHASLLPRHRGAAPVAWAILAGDAQTGVTTMLMDEGLDTGPILSQRATAIGEQETTPEVAGRLSILGADLLIETLAALSGGDLRPRPQDDTEATLAPSFKKDDGAIDWRSPAIAIERQVRALQPWPGAFTFRGGERLALWDAEAQTGADEAVRSSGEVVAGEGTELLVACGSGDLLRILTLQRAGGRRQSAADFLRGRSIDPGELLHGVASTDD